MRVLLAQGRGSRRDSASVSRRTNCESAILARARTCSASRRSDAAINIALPLSRQTSHAAYHARTYLGLLAAALDHDERGDEHFARAIEIQERDGMMVWAGRAHLGWAEALAAGGERERALEHAAAALELSRKHGYGLLEPRAAAILEGRPASAESCRITTGADRRAIVRGLLAE
jgi:tetratricopeptide (TPR) repeat protein